MCALVYLLGLKRYQPVARTATFIGLIGYTMAVLTLLLDIGRPDRFWHSMIYWNEHSLLWEVTMCVTLYLGVLTLEALPIFAGFEWLRSHWPKLARQNVAGASFGTLPGNCRPGALHAAPVIPGSHSMGSSKPARSGIDRIFQCFLLFLRSRPAWP